MPRSDNLKRNIEAPPVLSSGDPVNPGLPRLELGDKPVAFFESWPAWFFYIPVVMYWLYLSVKYRSFGLPMAVNANIELGGMVGESKADILNLAGPHAAQYILPFICETRPEIQSLQNCDDFWAAYLNTLLHKARGKRIELPFVIKPDLGCRGAGVQLIQSEDELIHYLQCFPAGRKFIIQQLAPYAAEAGVFYERMPGENTGRITSLTLKYRPYVQGDGKLSLQELIQQDGRAKFSYELYCRKNAAQLSYIPQAGEYVPLVFAGNHCRGSIFRNGEAFISPEMELAIDEILQDLPDFHYGRLDVKFADIASFRQGKDFFIIEINGASSEATHIWDSRTSLSEVFKTLFRQYRVLFAMGAKMRELGRPVPSAKKLIQVWLRELFNVREYPETE